MAVISFWTFECEGRNRYTNCT